MRAKREFLYERTHALTGVYALIRDEARRIAANIATSGPLEHDGKVWDVIAGETDDHALCSEGLPKGGMRWFRHAVLRQSNLIESHVRLREYHSKTGRL